MSHEGGSKSNIHGGSSKDGFKIVNDIFTKVEFVEIYVEYMYMVTVGLGNSEGLGVRVKHL